MYKIYKASILTHYNLKKSIPFVWVDFYNLSSKISYIRYQKSQILRISKRFILSSIKNHRLYCHYSLFYLEKTLNNYAISKILSNISDFLHCIASYI